MKKLILILLASFAFTSLSNAIPKEEEPTLKSINEKCKGKDSKFLEYEEIGMKQFAKNYLRICLNHEMQQAWEKKYNECLKSNNEKYCYSKTIIKAK